MTTLASVGLSNFRRFGEGARIEVGPGVTVLLAPNGVGKTTVFEAIEFALTQQLLRVGALEALIRDGESLATVHLEFDCGSVKAEVKKVGGAQFDGDVSEVLGHAPDLANLPFLLRLTHLLDQRQATWCTQATDSEAGRQLSLLPHSRSAAQANQSLLAVRQRITADLRIAEMEAESADSELRKWSELVNERDAAREEGSPRVSLKELASELRKISDTGLAGEPGIDQLEQEAAALLAENEQELSATRQATAELKSLEDIVSSFPEASERLRTARLGLENLREAFSATKAALEECELRMSSLRSEIQQAQSSHDQFANEQQALLIHQERLAKIADIGLSLDDLQRSLQELQVKKAELQQKLIRKKEFDDKLSEVARKVNDLEARRSQHQSLKVSINSWAIALEKFEETERLREIAEEEKSEADKRLDESRRAYEEAREKSESARRGLEFLQSTLGKIREAVAVIAERLPVGQTSCPLCKQHYPESELRMRIDASLSEFDPRLSEATEQARLAERMKEEAFRSRAERESTAQAATERLSTLKLLQAETADYIERLSFTEEWTDPQEALESIEEGLSDITGELIHFNAVRVSLVEAQGDELSGQEIEGQLEDADSTMLEIEEKISEQRALKIEIQESLSSPQTPETTLQEVDEKLAATRASLEEIRIRSEEEKKRREELSLSLRSQQEAVKLSEGDIRMAEDRVRKLQVDWFSASLTGEPSAEQLVATQNELMQRREMLSQVRGSLLAVRVELARWRASTRMLRLQKNIEEMKREESEEGFWNSLKYEMNERKNVMKRIARIRDCLIQLGEDLNIAVGDIQSQVRSISGLWGSTLRRIVLDERVASAGLELSTYYRKERAEVKVPLHDTLVRATDIASAAQATDLQLTFLLAMALGRPWSTWPALLLDDPTQHHDLVNCSAVFDLLREFVAEHGFQLLLATHDPLQARFFRRKLQNDGIPVRVWRLKPTPEGVFPVLEFCSS